MQTWKTLKREKVLERGKFLIVEDHTVALPDGRVIPDWPYLITPDYVNVLAITTGGLALCFRQTKYATGETLAIVGGYLEPGEDPAEAARRELLEETGHRAGRWTGLGSYVLDANRGCGQGHLFLAQDARPVQAAAADDLEEQHLVSLTLAELDEALRGNAFKALSWAATVSLALARLRA